MRAKTPGTNVASRAAKPVPGRVPGSGVNLGVVERRFVDVRGHRAMVSENRSKLLTKDTNTRWPWTSLPCSTCLLN